MQRADGQRGHLDGAPDKARCVDSRRRQSCFRHADLKTLHLPHFTTPWSACILLARACTAVPGQHEHQNERPQWSPRAVRPHRCDRTFRSVTHAKGVTEFAHQNIRIPNVGARALARAARLATPPHRTATHALPAPPRRVAPPSIHRRPSDRARSRRPCRVRRPRSRSRARPCSARADPNERENDGCC